MTHYFDNFRPSAWHDEDGFFVPIGRRAARTLRKAGKAAVVATTLVFSLGGESISIGDVDAYEQYADCADSWSEGDGEAVYNDAQHGSVEDDDRVTPEYWRRVSAILRNLPPRPPADDFVDPDLDIC